MSKKKESSSRTSSGFSDKGPVYLFTNENIAGYMHSFGQLDGAHVLTVCASGDHAFSAYLSGAAHVDTFDINSLQKSVMELKSHMIRDLEYEKFMSFFFDERDFFNKKIIQPISGKFSDDLRLFLQTHDKIGNSLFRYFGSHHSSYDVFKLPYLSNPTAYYELREKLPANIPFQRCPLDGISHRFSHWYTGMVPETYSGKYDLILLSNIFDYVCEDAPSPEEKMSVFYKKYLSPMAKNLLSRDNGIICFQYLWGAEPSAWGQYIKYLASVLDCNTFAVQHKMGARVIKSVQRGEEDDMVLTLRQRAR